MRLWWDVFRVTLRDIFYTPAPRPNQGKALDIVWHGIYGVPQEPPHITWMLQKHLDCADGTSWVSVRTGECVAGQTTSGVEIAVAWPDGCRYSTTAFAHELLHAASYYKDVPLGHSVMFYDKVAEANVALRVIGL